MTIAEFITSVGDYSVWWLVVVIIVLIVLARD
jgi:hypothetical protein